MSSAWNAAPALSIDSANLFLLLYVAVADIPVDSWYVKELSSFHYTILLYGHVNSQWLLFLEWFCQVMPYFLIIPSIKLGSWQITWIFSLHSIQILKFYYVVIYLLMATWIFTNGSVQSIPESLHCFLDRLIGTHFSLFLWLIGILAYR